MAEAANLTPYTLFFLDYNGTDWGNAARANFLAAVNGGVGVFVLHAANNAFEGWAEYEKMIGLQWDKTSTHSRYHEFKVSIADHEHPVTAGMSDFRITDELYGRLANRQNVPFQILATAYSDPAQSGTGFDEPVMIALKYGRGRIFQSILGHAWGSQAELPTFENKSFQEMLIRGCEWAATDEVAK
jgi:type 1 glutamine amidotransferase